MADELTTMLQQAGNAASPAPAGDPEGTGGAAPPNGAPAPAQPDADELPQGIKDYLAANPEHKAAVDIATAEMKRGWTPKLMEAAELRKKLDGLDDQSLNSLRELRRMAETDPAGAAHWLRQYAEQIAPTSAAPPPPQGDTFTPMTESEAVLYRQIQAMQAQLEKTQAGWNQLTMQQQAVQVNDAFNKLQQEMGVEVPANVRRDCWQASINSGGVLSPADIYFARNREAIGLRIAQKA